MLQTPVLMPDFPRLLSGRPVTPPITERQEEVLRWLIAYSEKQGHFPVLRETAAQFGLTLSRVQALMQQLEKRGYVARTLDRSRNVVLTELTRAWLERQEERQQEAQGQLPGV